MTRDTLLKLYPNASEAFIRRNSDPHEPPDFLQGIRSTGPDPWLKLIEPVGGLQDTVTQRSPGHAPVLADARKEKSPASPRLRLVITSHRVRLIDPDNLGGAKFLIDALRYSKLILDDSPDYITLELRQEKVAHKSEEGTLVEIWPDSRA